jgi:hypothetical protein
MLNTIVVILFSLIFLPMGAVRRKPDTDKSRLIGKVHTVRTEEAPVIRKTGKSFEGSRKISYFERYDTYGDRIASEFYDVGVLMSKSTYKYDAEGNRYEESQEKPGRGVSGGGSPPIKNKMLVTKSLLKCKYDENGNLVESVNYDGEGNLYDDGRDTYLYNSKGYLTEKRRYLLRDGSFRSSEVYTLNERGAVAKEAFSFHNSEGYSTYTYTEYLYDRNGNWIKRRVAIFSEGAAEPSIKMEYRIITYYPN